MNSQEKRIEEHGHALAKAIDQTWLKTREAVFAEVVHAYRQVEAEFVARADDDAFCVLETRRRVTEAIFREALVDDQSFEVCQGLWNELVSQGFANIERACTMSWFYADCCLLSEKPEAGIAVLEPLIAEIKQRLEKGTVREMSQRYHEEQLTRLHKLLTELITQRDAPPPP